MTTCSIPWCQPWTKEGTALLEKAAGQGHACAMNVLGSIHSVRKEHEQAVAWYRKGVEVGLPKASSTSGPASKRGRVWRPRTTRRRWTRTGAQQTPVTRLRQLTSPTCTLSAAVGASNKSPATLDPHFLYSMASHDEASNVCQTLGRGVTRSKRRAQECTRKAAENGDAGACLRLATRMYGDHPYAREVGHVGEAAGVATSAGVMEVHDVPPEVLTGVVHWIRKGGHDPVAELDVFRRIALKGAKYCRNGGCEVVGHLKEFKVCPQCKTARYCSDVCQKQDWTTGGHQEKCGTDAVSQTLGSRSVGCGTCDMIIRQQRCLSRG